MVGQGVPTCPHPQLRHRLFVGREIDEGTLTPPLLLLLLPTRSIADWLKPPDTWFLLDFIKPEFLLLRVGVPFRRELEWLSVFEPHHNLLLTDPGAMYNHVG